METKFYFIQGTVKKVMEEVNKHASNSNNEVTIVKFRESLEHTYAVIKVIAKDVYQTKEDITFI
jgi:hypothetical protein